MKKILFVCLLMISIVLSAQIKLGGNSTATGNAPVNSGYSYSYSQQIYKKQEINADTAGNITGLKFYLAPSANPSYLSNWVVYLGHTTKNSLNYQIGWIPVGEMTQVYSGTVTNVNGVLEVTFTTPFPYDNVRNLVVAVDENGFNSNAANPFFVYNSTEQALYTESNTVNPDPANPPNGHFLPYRPVVSLMGLVPNPLPDCPIINYPSDNASSVPVSPNITWAAVQGATGYKVSIGTTPGGTDVVNQQSVATTNFTPSSPLLTSTVYYLKVTAVASAGESSGCVNQKFTTVPAIPSNDECINAINLTVNPDTNCVSFTSGTTVMSTVSSPASSCGTSTGDVWYKFTATSSTHTVNLKEVTSVPLGGGYVYFQVLKGDCGNLTSILCSGSGCGYVTSASCPASVVNNLTVGETYYIKVFSGSGYSSHKFDICVGTLPPSPSNDNCIDAINVPVNSGADCTIVTSGTTLLSNTSPTPGCASGLGYDVWYKFTATGTRHRIKLINKVPVGLPNPSGGLQIRVFKGNCNNFVCSAAGGSLVLVNNLTVGETYYVRVVDYNQIQGSGFNFQICIQTDLTPAPANDECVNAVTVNVNPDLNCTAVTSGTTLGASASNVPGSVCNGAPDDDVWFKFTATATVHQISLRNVVGDGINGNGDASGLFEVFKGSCGNLTKIVCSNAFTGNNNIYNVSDLTIGETYYVRVFSLLDFGYAINFDICVGIVSPPANDDCSGALPVSVYPYSYTQADAQHTTNNNGFTIPCYNVGKMNNGTWFTFIGDGSNYRINVAVPVGSQFRFPGIALYTGSCGNLTCLKSKIADSANLPLTIEFSTVAGTVYYVNVGSGSRDTDFVEDVFTINIKNDVVLSTYDISKTEESIGAYPNPFTGVLNISKADKVKSVSILDSSGRLVKTIDTPSSSLHLEDLKEGLYLVVLNMKDGSKQTVKAIKR
ncbi:T9SS type A sorting domain-containing protein [Chryseobacterium sp. D764]|nr:T9SS type A sorting domain-containing protein [Chryseobacterium sp. D764]QXU49310.1 T9SS type A sorting domain-containing protein [Chryseobacterium sp. D764]